jgi:hypothetical protein
MNGCGGRDKRMGVWNSVLCTMPGGREATNLTNGVCQASILSVSFTAAENCSPISLDCE